MRKVGALGFGMLVVATVAYAGLCLPSEVYTLKQLKTAQSEARKKNKALTILYTDRNTTCPLANNASMNVIRQLKNESVIVYADSHKERGKLPRIIVEALHSPKAGKYIPMVVILDPDMTKVIDIIPYKREGGERDRLFTQAKKKMTEEMTKRTQQARELWLEGRKLMEENNYGKAIKCFKEAKAIAPGYSPPYYRLGLCYEKTGDTRKALENYNKYLELIRWESRKKNIRKKVQESVEKLKSGQQE